MSTATYAGTPVEVDAEGFLKQPDQSDRADGRRDRARERHRHADRPALAGHQPSCGPRIWRPARRPSIRTLGKASGVPIKELYVLLPEWACEACRQDRRYPQATRLHLESEHTISDQNEHEPIKKVSVIISKGSLEGITPA